MTWFAELSDWQDVAPEAEFPAGSRRVVDIDGMAIAVFNIDGRYCAIEDACSHQAQTLSDGRLDGFEIICPRHQARFSLVTGEALSPPAYEPIRVFPVRVEAGMVQVKLDLFD